MTEQQQQPGLFARIGSSIEMAQQGYEQLVNAIIRPPRADSYKVADLGPSEFTFLSQRFRRTDVELPTQHHNDRDTNNYSNNSNDEGTTTATEATTEQSSLTMKASVWTRIIDLKTEQTTEKKTIVVYLHGNASARLEVLPYLSFLLSQGVFGVASMDFTGSGQSDGDYVSLGYYERYDLETMLQYLQQTYGNNNVVEIILWGRSMGASTALMHASHKTRQHILEAAASASSNDNDANDASTGTNDDDDDDAPNTTTIIPKGLICDSPFASLPLLCEELVEKARSQGIVVPGVIVSVALAIIARSVRNRAQFDIHDIAPLDHVPTLPVPALFICGEHDDFIPPHHSERLIEAYQQGVRTNLFMVPGGHNDNRPPLVFEAVNQFLTNLTPGMPALEVPTAMRSTYIRCPPWAYKRNADIFQAHEKQSVETGAMRPEELGMTQERQDDIQNKIQTMFGQAS